ncbi:MAG: type II toxin-antitoxin system VapC family toxin [Methanoregula sp.]|uniref:type II toxin-antitoxin system VapC family toxin n=1 Tax=Methanoregula sp. TaxID=2052170 RepID=UPI0025EA0D48|nr:type II toxin-antitoxin system VapC family toxin [Methanoregula sp.]MCK9631815.1 type II toxin-antitoxin system VapC family toxin [Methanoregula sp.]
MSGKTVLDSGVIAAIFFPEELTATAIKKITWMDCVTVDLALAEVANVAAKRILSGKDSPDDVKIMLDDATVFIQDLCETIPAGQLIQPALDLACELNISLYDALFVAAAVRHRATLFTADTELSSVAKKVCRVRLLE